MKPIPHGTRTGYRKHGCRCLPCLTYQRALGKRHRDRVTAAKKCRDCGNPLSFDDISSGHIRDLACRQARNDKQRGVYQPSLRVPAVKPPATYQAGHRQPEPVKTPSSWWLEPRYQTDREAFMGMVAERLPEMMATGLTYRASWMEL